MLIAEYRSGCQVWPERCNAALCSLPLDLTPGIRIRRWTSCRKQSLGEHQRLCNGEPAHLPSLEQETSIHSSQPHDGVPSLEVLEAVALGVQIDAQALEQL